MIGAKIMSLIFILPACLASKHSCPAILDQSETAPWPSWSCRCCQKFDWRRLPSWWPKPLQIDPMLGEFFGTSMDCKTRYIIREWTWWVWLYDTHRCKYKRACGDMSMRNYADSNFELPFMLWRQEREREREKVQLLCAFGVLPRSIQVLQDKESIPTKIYTKILGYLRFCQFWEFSTWPFDVALRKRLGRRELLFYLLFASTSIIFHSIWPKPLNQREPSYKLGFCIKETFGFEGILGAVVQ